MLLMESLSEYDKKKFNVLAICCNRFWCAWCRKEGIAYVYYKLESHSYKFMSANAMLPMIFKLYNTYHSELGKILTDNKINLLVNGQQGVFVPSVFCRTIQPVHDLMHRYEPGFREIREEYAGREILFLARARTADVILTDSELGKKQYLECYYKKRRHNARVEVLPFTVSGIAGKDGQHMRFLKSIFFILRSSGNIKIIRTLYWR